MNLLLILFGKIVSRISSILNLGHGSTWPGHIALSLNSNFVRDNLRDSHIKIIVIAGTNGKTTTSKLIRTILERNGNSVFHNISGANLLNGIASAIVQNSNLLGKVNKDYAVFEIDENTLPLVLKELTPNYIILLNLFRDQLDRYGEVNTIASKWKKAIEQLNNKTIIVANADDPQIAYIGKNRTNSSYFGISFTRPGLSKLKVYEPSDSTYCPNCGSKLNYSSYSFSHLGDWKCPKCSLKRPPLAKLNVPVYPLPGVYNKYNVHAAVLLARLNNVSNQTIEQSLKSFKPAFGRQEIIELKGKKIQLFLSKNPTSFNESLRTVAELKGNHILFVLNDRIPDGRDVSWIWDTALEEHLGKFKHITVSGDRCYDMALRVKYSSNEFKVQNSKFKIIENLKESIEHALKKLDANETLYILPTYSAMLEVRKILTGKKIL